MHIIKMFQLFDYILFQLPSAASRAKLSMLNTMSKIRGQVKNPGYPQAEGLLGECMAKYGRELGEDTNFGKTCVCVVIISVDVCMVVLMFDKKLTIRFQHKCLQCVTL